jgi:hypothetical protein
MVNEEWVNEYKEDQGMDEEQVNKLFSSVPLLFKGYYKFSFTFTGSKDGFDIVACYGRGSDDIYKFEVIKDQPREFTKVDNWDLVVITMGDTEVFKKYAPW